MILLLNRILVLTPRLLSRKPGFAAWRNGNPVEEQFVESQHVHPIFLLIPIY